MANSQSNHPFLPEDPDSAPALLPESASGRNGVTSFRALDWRQALGGACLLLGALTLVLGWWGMSGTARTDEQLSFLLSGGLGGAAFVATGLTLLMAYEHAADRAAIGGLEERLGRLEAGLAGEFDAVHEHLDVRPLGREESARGHQSAAVS
jgi:hypothetical protein